MFVSEIEIITDGGCRRCWPAAEKARIKPPDGSVGNSDENALADMTIGLFSAEVIHRSGRWKTADAAQQETPKRVDWINTRSLLQPIGNILP